MVKHSSDLLDIILLPVDKNTFWSVEVGEEITVPGQITIWTTNREERKDDF